MASADIPPPRGVGGYFSTFRPLGLDKNWSSDAAAGPPESYHFYPVRTGTLSLLLVPVPVPVIEIASLLLEVSSNKRFGHLVKRTLEGTTAGPFAEPGRTETKKGHKTGDFFCYQ
jgi:hypothetical protein